MFSFLFCFSFVAGMNVIVVLSFTKSIRMSYNIKKVSEQFNISLLL